MEALVVRSTIRKFVRYLKDVERWLRTRLAQQHYRPNNIRASSGLAQPAPEARTRHFCGILGTSKTKRRQSGRNMLLEEEA
jgi:hypothetical protein